jgi:hypothetical protein
VAVASKYGREHDVVHKSRFAELVEILSWRGC